MPKEAPIRRSQLRLFADYHQIHLLDERSKGDLGEAWTVKATEDRVAVADGMVGIGTEQAQEVSVDVIRLDTAPALAFENWDHVTESSIDLATGRLVIAGCMDCMADAVRIELSQGCWRVRVAHRGLASEEEHLRVELWRGDPVNPRVLKRWVPPPAGPRPSLPPENWTAVDAAHEARQGNTDQALEVLLHLAAIGDAAASASAAEILAFLGNWGRLVPLATALIANPRAVHAGNVFTDMCGLVRRASRELQDPGVIRSAADQVPAGLESQRDAVLLRDSFGASTRPSIAKRRRFDAAVLDAQQGRTFQDRPDHLAVHCFNLAVSFGVDDEILARWDERNPRFLFQHAVEVARVLVRRKDPHEAWAALELKLPLWYPVSRAQVAPVILLLDPLLAPLMTPARCGQVLRTPRGSAE